jgi:tellurite resistance protein
MAKRLQRRDAAIVKSETVDTASPATADLMEATVAACALIAFVDRKLDIKERRSLFTLFQCFTGFSYADVEREFARHKRAFDEDPAAARHEAFATLRSFQANVVGAQLVLNACRANKRRGDHGTPAAAANCIEKSTRRAQSTGAFCDAVITFILPSSAPQKQRAHNKQIGAHERPYALTRNLRKYIGQAHRFSRS